MRSIELPDGVSIDVRGLTRKEVRAFRNEGVDFNAITMARADSVMDQVLEAVLTEEQQGMLDNLENKYAVSAFRACMKETFGSPDEEKNSSAT